MVSIDEFEEIVEELYEELPEEIFEGLNGGIIIEEESRDVESSLACLGLYERSILGNCIRIYYGSFMSIYSFLDRELLKVEVRKTLHHEITHHLEHLARENDLEIEDMKFMMKYRNKEKLDGQA